MRVLDRVHGRATRRAWAVLLAVACLSAAASADPFLTPLQRLDASSGIPSRTIAEMVPSPDGRFLYAADAGFGVLRVFERDEGTGLFAETVMYRDDTDGMSALGGLSSIAMSPDGAHLYVASDTIAVLDRDAETGALSQREAQPLGHAAVKIAVAPDGLDVYAFRSNGSIAAYSRDPSDGTLTWRETEPAVEPVYESTDLAISADGKNLYTTATSVLYEFAYYWAGTVRVYSRDPATGDIAFVETHDAVPGARAVAPSADGASVYVASWTLEGLPSNFADYAGRLRVYDRDPADGTLAERENRDIGAAADVVPVGDANVYVAGIGCSHFVIGCNGPVLSFPVDAETGALGSALPKPAGFDLGQARVLASASADDELFAFGPLFSASPGAPISEDRLALLSRDVETGALAWQQTLELAPVPYVPLVSPYDVAVPPDGAHVYVSDGEVIRIFARTPADGRVAYQSDSPEADDALGDPMHPRVLAVSPNGAHLYAQAPEGVVVYARDAVAGTLQVVQVLEDGVGGVAIGGSYDAALTSDGKHLYLATGSNLAATGFAVFARDAATGLLTQGTGVVFGEGELAQISALSNNPSWIALSPDGKQLYARARMGSTRVVVALSRDPATGALSLLETELLEVGTGPNCCQGRGIAVSADGRHVYAATVPYEGIAIFDRDPNTGALSFRAAPVERSHFALLSSPDARRLLSVSDGFSAWERNPRDGSLAPIALDPFASRFLHSAAFSADGRNLYGVAPPRSLAVFAVPEAAATALGAIACLALAALRSRR